MEHSPPNGDPNTTPIPESHANASSPLRATPKDTVASDKAPKSNGASLSNGFHKDSSPGRRAAARSVSPVFPANSYDERDPVPLEADANQASSANQTTGDGADKWTTLAHNGVLFPPAYEPHGVGVVYDGVEIPLEPEAEEAATFFAVLRDTNHVTKPRFCANFFSDWKKLLPEDTPIKELSKVDFSLLYDWFQGQNAAENIQDQHAPEAKASRRAQRERENNTYGWAIVDGEKRKVLNYRLLNTGLFRGRGEHPKMGTIKKRVMPEDVTLNIGHDEPIPKCSMPGHQWGGVTHDRRVEHIAKWKDATRGSMVYAYLEPASLSSSPRNSASWNVSALASTASSAPVSSGASALAPQTSSEAASSSKSSSSSRKESKPNAPRKLELRRPKTPSAWKRTQAVLDTTHGRDTSMKVFEKFAHLSAFYVRVGRPKLEFNGQPLPKTLTAIARRLGAARRCIRLLKFFEAVDPMLAYADKVKRERRKRAAAAKAASRSALSEAPKSRPSTLSRLRSTLLRQSSSSQSNGGPIYPMLPVSEHASLFAMVAGSDDVLETLDVFNNFLAFWVDFLDDVSFWSSYRLLPPRWSEPLEWFISRLWFATVVIDLYVVIATYYVRTRQIESLEKRMRELSDLMSGARSASPTHFSASSAGQVNGVNGVRTGDAPERLTQSQTSEEYREMQEKLRRLRSQRIKAFIYIWKFLGDLGTAILGVVHPDIKAKHRVANWYFGVLSGCTSLLAQWRATAKR